MKDIKIKQIFQIILAIGLTAVFLRIFIIDSFIVKGDSMAPSISDGDYVFINKLAYYSKEPKRGDIIVVKPRFQPLKIIKRVIGLPDERVEIANGLVYIKNARKDESEIISESYLNLPETASIGLTAIKLDTKEYFVLGDNRNISIDSRELGPIDSWDIEGRVFFVFKLKSFSFKLFGTN